MCPDLANPGAAEMLVLLAFPYPGLLTVAATRLSWSVAWVILGSQFSTSEFSTSDSVLVRVSYSANKESDVVVQKFLRNLRVPWIVE